MPSARLQPHERETEIMGHRAECSEAVKRGTHPAGGGRLWACCPWGWNSRGFAEKLTSLVSLRGRTGLDGQRGV